MPCGFCFGGALSAFIDWFRRFLAVGTFAADWADASLLSDLASFSRVALFESFSDVNRLAVTSVAVRCDCFF